MTASEAAEYIKSIGVTTDGLTYAISFDDTIPSYQLKSSSPCIGAGIDTGIIGTDIKGNAVPGAVGYDIGPYSYMPGWTVSDGTLPTDGQLFKSHAAPIAVKKLTVFPGVASVGQIREAGE